MLDLTHTKKDIPRVRAKGEATQDGRRGTITCKIKLHTHQGFSEGSNKTLCVQGPRERSSDPTRDLSQACLWVFGSLWQRRGLTVACLRVRHTDCSILGGVACWPKSLGVVCHYPQFSLRPNYREGTHPHPSAENFIKDLLRMALPTGARPSFPHIQSLPSGSFHKPLILIYQRADRMTTTIAEN